jgi:hypothetical protein
MKYTKEELRNLGEIIDHPGWRVVEKYVRRQIDRNEKIPALGDKASDVDILNAVRKAKIKAEVYKGLISNIEKEVKSGRRNDAG